MTELKNVLWGEKYRPNNIDNPLLKEKKFTAMIDLLVLPEKLKDRFKKGGIDNNMIFFGSSGTGKTTLASVLSLRHKTLKLNASHSTSIDDIRTKVVDFLSVTMKGEKRRKVVFFDECDRLSENAQDALKAMMEEDHIKNSAFFVFTTNHIYNVRTALLSRLESFDFDNMYSNRENRKVMQIQIKDILLSILKNEGGYTLDKELGNHIIKTHYPDVRAMINTLYSASRMSNDSHLKLEDIKCVMSRSNDEFYDIIINTKPHNFMDIRGYIKSNYNHSEMVAIEQLGEPFLDYCAKNGKYKIGLSVAIHKYQYEINRSIDKQVSLIALCEVLNDIINK